MNRYKSVKFLSAVIGGNAVVAMGALAMSFTQEQSAPDMVLADMNIGPTITKSGAPTALETPMAVPSIKEPIDMDIGPTITKSGAPTALETPIAVPSIRGPAPLPAEQQAACWSCP